MKVNSLAAVYGAERMLSCCLEKKQDFASKWFITMQWWFLISSL